jgi:hypothetical protein
MYTTSTKKRQKTRNLCPMSQNNKFGRSQQKKPRKYHCSKATPSSKSMSPLYSTRKLKASSSTSYVTISFIKHNLEVNKNHPPVKQKLHKMSKERKQVAKAEVQCLLDAGVI